MESVAWAMCRKSTGLEAETNILLEGVGPALVAVAVTSKPHLDQRSGQGKSKRIEVIDENGQKLVKVPLFPKGIFRHPQGHLVFNDPFITRLRENYEKKVTGRPVYLDFRHGDQYGAIAYLDPEDGGRVEMGADDWLYAYGKPTVDNIEQIVKQWPHASVEFAPNYEANLVNKLSSDDLEPVDIMTLVMEDDMPKEIKVGAITLSLEPVEGGYVLSEANITTLQEMAKGGGGNCAEMLAECKRSMAEYKKKLEAAEAKIVKLEKGEEDWGDVPEHVRVRLEAQAKQIRDLEKDKLVQKVAFTLEQARQYRDSNGRGHSKVFLDALQAGLTLEEFKVGEEVIKLEAQNEEGAVKYFKNLLVKLAETLPGQVPMEGQTEPTEQRPGGNGFFGHYTEDELKLELENFKRY